MSYAHVIKEIGRGAEGSRDMSCEEAQQLYGAMLDTERSMAEGRYEHAGQAIVDWAVGNAKCVARGNAMLVTKEVSGKAKIDPVMSSFNAMELMSYNPPARTGGYSLDNLTMMG